MELKLIKEIILAGNKANVSTIEYNGLKITYKAHQEEIQSFPAFVPDSVTQAPEANGANPETPSAITRQQQLLEEEFLLDPAAFEARLAHSE